VADLEGAVTDGTPDRPVL